MRKEQKNASPDEEVLADSSEMKLKQVHLCEQDVVLCWLAKKFGGANGNRRR